MTADACIVDEEVAPGSPAAGMVNTVRIHGPLGFDTHYRATRAFITHSRVTLVGYVLFVGAPLLALAVMLAARSFVNGPATLGLPGWGILLSGPAFMFAGVPALCALSVWQLRRTKITHGDGVTCAVSLERFESHGSGIYARAAWDEIHRVVETRNFFLFYTGGTTAQFIPKDFVESPADLQAMREIIHVSLGSRAKLQVV
ncbi:MAG TPA: YcxB family protein [Verrucomicrobiae bacterium]